MARPPKPSPTQRLALELAAVGGGLVRYSGGFWSSPGHPLPFYDQRPLSEGRRPTPPHVAVGTVRAMERRGWLANVEPDAPEWRARRELTDAGRALLDG